MPHRTIKASHPTVIIQVRAAWIDNFLILIREFLRVDTINIFQVNQSEVKDIPTVNVREIADIPNHLTSRIMIVNLALYCIGATVA